MTARRAVVAVALTTAVFTAACSSNDGALQIDTSPDRSTTAPGSTEAGSTEAGGTASTGPDATSAEPSEPADVEIAIDASAPGEPISPLILGLSTTLSADELRQGGITLNSWGGNPSTRFNYQIGHAWNHGADYEFRNTNYGDTGNAAVNFLDENTAGGAVNRLAVPTLGWVASNDDENTCSFPVDGGCLNRDQAGNCADPKEAADPTTANVESTPEGVAAWVQGLLADGHDIEIVSMDNEPDLWGYTHYDVHPQCTTYEEILDKYLTYATAIREVAPDLKLAGPVMCCWYDYWNIAPGPADGSDQDFLEWFLQQVKAHDDETGQRTLDVVDVHFYPQSDVFNENTDPETNARRLRSTRALWDGTYADESWIRDTIRFIPRMKDTIERTYPGTPLLISEWNFGADKDINGALAIAEVLGVYGREGVYAAAYWREPPVGSPGFFAFTMHGNYDGQGSRFGGSVVPAESSDSNRISSYAALDEETGMLRVMLINKDPSTAFTVGVQLNGFEPLDDAKRFTYGPDDLGEILADTATVGQPITLPASSITVLELEPAP